MTDKTKNALLRIKSEIDSLLSEIPVPEIKPIEKQKPQKPAVIDLPLNEGQYIKEVTGKKQIVLHHTVSGSAAKNVVDWWNHDPNRIATHFVIERDGDIYQLFDLKYWAHHIGLKDPRNLSLNKAAIGIELVAWGGILEKDGSYLNAYGRKVDSSDIEDCNFRGWKYFQKYTKEQVEAVRKLVLWLSSEFNIPVDFDMTKFDVSKDAQNGISGLWTHNSYRIDKSDIYPNKDIVKMLTNLK